MPVFISHKDVDKNKALALYQHLRSHGINSYVDVLDNTTQTTDDITALITKRMSECTHLIAVMSDATKDSWWVPFEIGEATFGDRRITSFDTGCRYNFPEYLKKWPVMKSELHLKMFISAYKSENRALIFKESLGSRNMQVSKNADTFHHDLKSRIMRGY